MTSQETSIPIPIRTTHTPDSTTLTNTHSINHITDTNENDLNDSDKLSSSLSLHSVTSATPLSSSPKSLQVMDQLDRKLKHRSDKKDLISRNIIKSDKVSPALLSAQTEIAKARLESQLNKKLSNRPTKETLQSQNIIKVGDPKILQVQSALNRALIERTLELRLSEKYGRRWASLNMREAEPLVQWNKTRSSFDSGTNFQPSNTDNSTNTSTSNNNNNNSSSRNIPKDDSIEKLKKSQHLLESLKESSVSSNSSVSASSAASASVDKKSSPAVPISSTTALTPSSSSSSSAGSPPTFISTSPVPLLSQRKKRGGLSSKHLNIKDGHSYSRVDRQLSIQSVTHKSEFITSIEKSGKFVCHNCCTEDGLGPELNSSRYTYQDYFNEKAWANIDNLEPPIHNPEAKKLSMCNTCYGLCSCGRELSKGVCDNCGSLAPITCDQVRAAPEFPRPVFKEDIVSRKQQQLSKQQKQARVDVLTRQIAIASEDENSSGNTSSRRHSNSSVNKDSGSSDGDVSSSAAVGAERLVKRTKKKVKKLEHHHHHHRHHHHSNNAELKQKEDQQHEPLTESKGAEDKERNSNNDTNNNNGHADNNSDQNDETDDDEEEEEEEEEEEVEGDRDADEEGIENEENEENEAVSSSSSSSEDEELTSHRTIKFDKTPLILGTFTRYRYLNVFMDECLFVEVQNGKNDAEVFIEGTDPLVSIPITESNEYFWYYSREAGGDLFAISKPQENNDTDDNSSNNLQDTSSNSNSTTLTPPPTMKPVFPASGPVNKSGVYLVDKINRSVYYFCDKKLGEYFAWKIETGDVVQVS